MRVNLLRTAAVLAIFVLAVADHDTMAAPPGGSQPDPALAYQAARSNPVTHDVDFSVIVTPPYHCQVLKVWLPVPTSDAAQEISAARFSTFPLQVRPQIHTEEVYGNRFAYFEFHNPHGAQIIRHRFQAKVWQLDWRVDPARVQPVTDWPKSFARYLKPQPVARQRAFQDVLGQLEPREEPGIYGAMRWIDANLTYDHEDASLRADAAHAFTKRHGHCSDYHGLCATMGRALGYPTRVTYGLALFPKNSPSHCKVEAFLPPYGWVSFDLSETQKLVAKIARNEELSAVERDELTQTARRRLRQGFRENSWLLLTRGANYELAPKACDRVPVVRTAYVEADGQPLPDPDPANAAARRFSWMTAHKYTADRDFKLPFKDISTLAP